MFRIVFCLKKTSLRRRTLPNAFFKSFNGKIIIISSQRYNRSYLLSFIIFMKEMVSEIFLTETTKLTDIITTRMMIEECIVSEKIV